MLRIEMLPAYEGDSLWVEYGAADAPRRMIIDAGRKKTYQLLIKRLAKLKQPVELFTMTHVDDDHIFGALPLFADKRVHAATFKDVWYNGFTHLDKAVAHRPPADLLGPQNGEIFAALLLKGQHPWNEAFDHGATAVVPDTGKLPRLHLADDMTLTLHSPTWEGLAKLKTFWEEQVDKFEPGDAKAALRMFAQRPDLQPDLLGGLLDVEGRATAPEEQDSTEPNGSSIAFLAEHEGHAVLFTGDAHPRVLEQSVARLLSERGETLLKLDALKVSHHGSKNNTSSKLLSMLDCRNFLISTNGVKHEHPDKEAIARIVYRNRDEPQPTQLYFNFRTDWNKVWDDEDLKDEWNYRTHYPPEGCVLAL